MASKTVSLPQPAPPAATRQQIEDALDLVRPAVRDDGGDVELVGCDDGTVTIRFQGACVKCPSREMTLKHGIESHLIQQVPGVERVREADD